MVVIQFLLGMPLHGSQRGCPWDLSDPTDWSTFGGGTLSIPTASITRSLELCCALGCLAVISVSLSCSLGQAIWSTHQWVNFAVWFALNESLNHPHVSCHIPSGLHLGRVKSLLTSWVSENAIQSTIVVVGFSHQSHFDSSCSISSGLRTAGQRPLQRPSRLH